MKRPTTRVAVVGVGRIGRQHALAVRRSPELVLSAVVDPNAAARQAAGADALQLESVSELLAAGAADVAIVAVPTTHHLDVAFTLIDAKIPVLCEKPGGLTSADARLLADRAAARAVLLRIGYWRRFVPALRELRDRIQTGELGTIAMLLAAQWDGEPPTAAFRDPESSGGILVDMGVHEFDMLRWLSGQEILDVVGMASSATYAEPVPGDPETVNLVASLSLGATAVISLARRHPPGDVCRVEVLGGDGVSIMTYLDPANGDRQLGDALQAQAESFAREVAAGDGAGASADDAFAALEAAERAGSAIAALERVPVPESS